MVHLETDALYKPLHNLMNQFILFEIAEGVARITLNRPEVHHALNPGILAELKEAILEAETDNSVRVVVLSASGEKAFCSGADLKSTLESGLTAGEMLQTYYNPLITAIRNLPKPVICRMNGLAAGAGSSLALSCDVVIAHEQAYLSQIFVKIGLMPDAGGTFFLPRLIGLQKAFELASTGRNVYAPEAARIGLIHSAVSDIELDDAVNKMASYYATAPTKAIGLMKQALNQSYQSNLEEMLELEAQYQQILSKSSDAAEGIQSFLQKRKPDYQGK